MGKPTWTIHFLHGLTMEIQAYKLTWDWASENVREMFMLEEESKHMVGTTIVADGVEMAFDEPFKEPKI